MDCKYVRESQCLCFAFHPLASSLFYLTNTKNRLRIVEENLYTGLVTNELAVPLREQNLNVDNYILNYSPEGRLLALTLSNHLLVYSLQQKNLILVAQAQISKSPLFIQKAVLRKNMLYFSATEQHQLFALSLPDAVRNGTISNLMKFKLPPDVVALALAVGNGRIAAICSDCNLRVWQQNGNLLKGAALQKMGQPTCLSFSKDGQYLLIGSSLGWIQVWDGATLGVANTVVLNKQVGKQKIQSVSWFHYSGEGQSRRFLVLGRDGNLKLYSLYFERSKQKEKWMGRANELSLLYSHKGRVRQDFEVRSHEFANFIYFHPGVLLYMVDYYPRIYYPVVPTQFVHSFDSLVPNNRKQIAWQPNFFFLDHLQLKRLRGEVEDKLSLGSVLDYEGLKVLKLDYRPKFLRPDELPLKVNRGIPCRPLRYKFLVLYYLGNMVRALVLSNVSLIGGEAVQTLKQYAGHAVIFLGPNRNLQPLLLILQQDRQTVTVLSEGAAAGLQQYHPEQRQYLSQSGQIYIKQLKIKVQRVFQTPFRLGYVVLYLSDNLVRFSNNIQVQAALLDYEVYTGVTLRLDYSDILIDIVWTAGGQLGCAVCLEKLFFITDDLKVVRSVPIEGYVIQAQFTGYTLIVTTKVDVQYVDVTGKPLQLYSIQNYESRYLILGVMADRIIGIERIQGQCICKVRYFNLMQPLLAGYLSYYALVGAPPVPAVLKTVVEGFSPYHIVSEQFLQQLNRSGLNSFSKYFIESHVKLYSRSLRAATLNSRIQVERFLPPRIWTQYGSKILDYLLYYEELKDSTDAYDRQKARDYESKLSKIIGSESLQKIKAAGDQVEAGRVEIAANFGEQALFQVFYDFNQKQCVFIKMQFHPFKATDDREWIGLNALYLESKPADNDNETDAVATIAVDDDAVSQDDPDAGQFSDLLVYYRCDDGKGDSLDDLSDYANEGTILVENNDPWMPLPEDEPMQLQDKWGKKCPPQFAVAGSVIKREKRINGRTPRSFSFQVWFKTEANVCQIVHLGEFTFGLSKGQFYYTQVKHEPFILAPPAECEYFSGAWTQVSFSYGKTTNFLKFWVNGIQWYSGKAQLKAGRQNLTIGSEALAGALTEFRLWRRQLTAEQVKDYLRTPLDIVAQKRKRLKMKIKQKKKEKKEQPVDFFPAFPF